MTDSATGAPPDAAELQTIADTEVAAGRLSKEAAAEILRQRGIGVPAPASAPGDAGDAGAEQQGDFTPDQLKIMADGQRQLWAAGQRAQLDRFGFTQERINLARGLVAEIETTAPGLVAYLQGTGAGDDARIVANLVLHSERLNSRPVKR